jgi:hypothetical protein
MNKLLASTALVAALVLPTSLHAQDAVVGAGVGATAGAIAGSLVGGPIGAVIGGFAGASIAGAASVPEPVIEYTIANPVEPVYLEGDIVVGAVLDPNVTVQAIPGDEQFGYFYANGRAYVIDLSTREIVYSPGYVVSQDVVTYVEANPIEPVTFQSDLVVGYEVPSDVVLTPVPDSRTYSYVYVDGTPVVVDTETRLVVWSR